jgi:hypothetical protein
MSGRSSLSPSFDTCHPVVTRQAGTSYAPRCHLTPFWQVKCTHMVAEYGVFAAVSDAYFTGDSVVVCGTAGPGITHSFNGLLRDDQPLRTATYKVAARSVVGLLRKE